MVAVLPKIAVNFSNLERRSGRCLDLAWWGY